MTKRLLFLFVSLFTLLTAVNATSLPDYTSSNITIPCVATSPTDGLEGTFILYNNNIMWRFEGAWRWVRSILTWNGLFSGQNVPTYNHTEIISPLGEYLEADNGLIRDPSTLKVYFREGTFIRHIYSESVFNFYHFNWAAVKDVNSLSGYTIGNPIGI